MNNDTLVREVHKDLQSYIGDTARHPLGKIRARDFQRFAIASGNLDPVFFDHEAARRHGYSGVIAPPMYLSSVMGWEAGPPEESLLPDGNTSADVASLPLQGLRLMGAGQDLEFFEPATDGMEVVMERSVDSVELKEGRSGSMVLITIVKRYLQVDGQILLVSRESFIGR